MTDIHDSSRPRLYQIKVKGDLDRKWSDWFDGFVIVSEVEGETVLTGEAADQAALHGMLNKIRDLGLPLLSVRYVDPQERE
jgi:hypothetical protein